MSFADPLSITIGGVTTSLPKTSVEGDKTEYTSGDGTIKVSVDHDYKSGGRTRRVLRVDTAKVSADPFKPDQNVTRTMSFYIVFDTPPAGYTAAEQLAVASGLIALMTATSNAALVKLLGGES